MHQRPNINLWKYCLYVLEMDIKGDLLVFDATTIHSAGSWRLWFCCGSAPPLLMTLNTTRCLYGPISRRVKLMGSNWVGLDRNRTSSAGLESSLRKQQNHLWPYHRFLHITSNLADHWLVQRCERSEAKVALGFNRKGWKGEEREKQPRTDGLKQNPRLIRSGKSTAEDQRVTWSVMEAQYESVAYE